MLIADLKSLKVGLLGRKSITQIQPILLCLGIHNVYNFDVSQESWEVLGFSISDILISTWTDIYQSILIESNFNNLNSTAIFLWGDCPDKKNKQLSLNIYDLGDFVFTENLYKAVLQFLEKKGDVKYF